MKYLNVLLCALCLFTGAASSLHAQDIPLYNKAYEKSILEHLVHMRETQSSGMHNVPTDDGKLLRMIVRMHKPEKVLEIGTANGYSALWIALGLAETGGRLTTIEIDEEKHSAAVRNFATVHMESIIHPILGDALEIVPSLDERFDMVFIDVPQIARQVFEDIFPKVTPGGILLCHAVRMQAPYIRDFTDWLLQHPKIETLILPLTRPGISLSYKSKNPPLARIKN